MHGECEEDGAGEATGHAVQLGSPGALTSLQAFQTALLAFIGPLAQCGEVGGNIYHLKHVSQDTLHVFVGD